MSVAGRNNWLASQRVDLPDLLANDSYNRFDFRSVMFALCGQKSFIVSGFEISSWTGLTASVNISDAVVWCPDNDTAPFYQGLSTDEDLQVTLQASSTIYLELILESTTQTSVTKGFWDPLATTPTAPAGVQFTESVDAQVVITPTLKQRFGGFTEGSIKIAVITTSPTTITSVQDAREPFFNLRRGGSTPDAFFSYPWSSSRSEPPATTTLPTDLAESDPQSIYYNVDTSGNFINDKGIRSFKEWMDAVMTILKEIKQTPTWYQLASAASGFPSNLSLYSLLLDSQGGHALSSTNSTTIYWSKPDGGGAADNKLRSEGASPVIWDSNYGRLTWQLGGTFTAFATDRSYTSNNFATSTVTDGFSVYLKLQRDAILNSDPNVTWKPTTAPHSGFTAAQSVSGSAGDFTGIAVGDFVRKESEGYLNYYMVTGVWDGSSKNTTTGFVSTSVTDAIELDQTIPTQSTEGYKYFRSRYDNSDIFLNSGSTITDVDYYWLGRRSGSLFMFRDYGTLDAGEEVEILNDSEQDIDYNDMGSMPIFRIDDDASFIGTTPELVRAPSFTALRDTTTVIDIFRSKTINRENTGPTTTNRRIIHYILINNLGAPTNALTFSSDGDELWVRLSDTASASAYTLSPGTIASGTDNVYQILSPGSEPLRNYDNRNVFMIARRIDIGGISYLFFTNGEYLRGGNVTNTRRPIRYKRVTVSSSYTATIHDHMISVDTSGGAYTMTLPSAASVGDGFVLDFKDKSGDAEINPITLDGNGGDTIDGQLTMLIDWEYGSLRLISDGVSSWEVR